MIKIACLIVQFLIVALHASTKDSDGKRSKKGNSSKKDADASWRSQSGLHTINNPSTPIPVNQISPTKKKQLQNEYDPGLIASVRRTIEDNSNLNSVGGSTTIKRSAERPMGPNPLQSNRAPKGAFTSNFDGQSNNTAKKKREEDDGFKGQAPSGLNSMPSNKNSNQPISVLPSVSSNRDDDDDYYDQVTQGLFEEEEKKEEGSETTVQAQHTHNVSISGIFKFDDESSGSGNPSYPASVYSSTLGEQQQHTTICSEDATIYKEYHPSGTPSKSPPQLSGPKTTDSEMALSSSYSSSFSPPNRFIPLSSSRSPVLSGSSNSMNTMQQSPKSSMDYSPHRQGGHLRQRSDSSSKRVLPRRSMEGTPITPTNSMDIIERHMNKYNGNRMENTDNCQDLADLLTIKQVENEVNTLRAAYNSQVFYERSDVNQNSGAKKELDEGFEDDSDKLVDYSLLTQDQFGDECLAWYLQGRHRSYVIQDIHESTLLDVVPPTKLNDGGSHWFDPIDAFVKEFRILVIKAIGIHFVVAHRYCVVPVLLKTGDVVGFWQDISELPWPRWRPILSIRMTKPFPFDRNGVDLAIAAQLAENDIRKKYFADNGGDLWLERASLELSSFPSGIFPVNVELQSFFQCMHLVGWRLNSKPLNQSFLLEINNTVSMFFRSYMMERSVYSDHLIPKQIKKMTSYTQGILLDSFPKYFNTSIAFNHLLLLPGGNRNWAEGFGDQQMFNLLFGPLVQWLKDPTGYPYSELQLFNGANARNTPKTSIDIESCSPNLSAVVGAKNKEEFPDEYVSIPSLKNPRSYCLIRQSPLTVGLPSPRPSPSPRSLEQSPKSPGLDRSPNSANNSSLSSSMVAESPAGTSTIHRMIQRTMSIGPKILRGSSQGSTPAATQLTRHNPLVDLMALEDALHFFQDACHSEQMSAAAAAEIIFSRLIFRCCIILSTSPSVWILPTHTAVAEKNFQKIRMHFVNQINALLIMSRNIKWRPYASFDEIGSAECYLIYHRLVTGHY